MATRQDRHESTVLVVDDNPGICELLQTVLEDANYGVGVASNGREALSMVADARPDLVLTDVMMPVLDGHGLYAALHADPRYTAIPIAFMSTSRPIQLAPGEHPAATIAKPFDLDVLLATIDGLIANRSPKG